MWVLLDFMRLLITLLEELVGSTYMSLMKQLDCVLFASYTCLVRSRLSMGESLLCSYYLRVGGTFALVLSLLRRLGIGV